ncbi:MAG: hypothetical protein DMF61_25125 [Blastocatellia bacterium AA13]|nr:MAG: hypothetical protein DMF61_25125 [Blastocatellia bacterium AA13]
MRQNREPISISQNGSRLRLILFCVVAVMLVSIPTAISSFFYRTTVLPKYVLLVVGASLILMLLLMMPLSGERGGAEITAARSRLTLLLVLFLITVVVSTAFGAAPLGSLFGSYDNQMGLLSYLCFFVCYAGLIIAIGANERWFVLMLWSILFTGLVVAAYAVAQFVGRDPFLSPALYTYPSPDGPITRVPSTLGHSNYLGNFLLYTTPISAAMAFASTGSARRIAISGVALSIAAIAFSGTRGAWLGLLGSGIVFAILERRKTGVVRTANRKGRRVAIIGTSAFILVSVLIIAAIPRSRSILLRGRAFVTDGLTGSGRTILWRDAARMVPSYALIGCGPEGFSKAFLPYKSDDLAKNAPQINNESSHNSYLDSAISYGLLGAVFYAAVIAYAFLLLFMSRRAAASKSMRLTLSGLAASLVGICIHNFFIYNQIPTGLYFFSFLALTVAASNIVAAHASGGVRAEAKPTASRKAALILSVIAGTAVVFLAVYYASGIARSDAALERAFDYARAGSIEQVISNGDIAAAGPDPIHAYDYQVARAITQSIDISEDAPLDTAGTATERNALRARRMKAIETAMAHSELSLPRSLTPEASAVLLAYLAFKSGDAEKLRACAERAVKLDSRLFSARWLMAEALLSSDDREGAIREARAALALAPSSAEAHSVLKRARGEFEDLLKRAKKAERKGKLDRAEAQLRRAVRDYDSCLSCHRALALFWERRARWADATIEWERLFREAADAVAKDEAAAHLQAIKERARTGG